MEPAQTTGWAARRNPPRTLILIATLIGALAVALLAPVAATAKHRVIAKSTRVVASRTVDPNHTVQSLDSFAVAADGTGGLAYTASVGGVAHVFLMRLRQGVLSRPIELDAGLSGGSSQPVLAAAPGGKLIAAFVNGGDLYVSEALSSRRRLSAPRLLVSNASNPALSLNKLGQGYLALTQAAGSGGNVEVYYWGGARWRRAKPNPLNVTPADDAGSGSGRPAVIAAHDGIGLVSWGENGHVYARRVWGTLTSVQTKQLDPPTYRVQSGGSTTDWSWQQAGNPEVASDGVSTYMDVAFEETMTDGFATTARVFVARLVAERVASRTAVDGLGALGTGGGTGPQIVMNENGFGLVTDTAAADGAVTATSLGLKGKVMNPLKLSSADPLAADPVPVGEGNFRTMTAWLRPYAGDSANPQVVARYSSHLGRFGPLARVSAPAAGPVDDSAGLLAGGDAAGDGLIAWLQGSPWHQTIHLGGLLVAPGKPHPRRQAPVGTRFRPVLHWRRARESFGTVTYTVRLAGRTIGHTRRRSLRLPFRLAPGSHRWRVIATNVAGQSTASRSRILRVIRHPVHRGRPKHHHRHRKHHKHHHRRHHARHGRALRP